MNVYIAREIYHVNDSPPKKAKFSSADDSGNESDTSIVVEKCPVPDYSINKLKLIFNETESQGENSNNQNQTPNQSNNNGDEPNEQVDVEPIQRIHGDRNQEIGRVMGFGWNEEGLLQEGLNEIITTPTALDQIGEAKFIKADEALCSIDENGKLTVNGEQVNTDKKFKFAIQSCGSVFAIDEDDHLLSWGKNDAIPLGHGHKEKVKEPTLIKALKHLKIKQVCCAKNIVMCVTMDNWLYIWGKGSIICAILGFDGDILSPIGITQYGQVQQISMTFYHALLLCSDGNVYSVGSNESGQLGLGHENEAPDFNKIDQFDSIEVLKVQAGTHNSAFLTKNGDVYVFGDWGETIYTKQHLVEGLTGVVDISMFFQHILGLTGNNELFAWGGNTCGECEVGSEANYITTPTRVVGLEDKEILQISAGAYYSLIKYKTKP